jgi:hypothetical protein
MKGTSGTAPRTSVRQHRALGKRRRLAAAWRLLLGPALGLALVVAAAASPAGASAEAGHHHTFVVHPGESIQAAVNLAGHGDTVKVKAGTYHEEVAVATDNLSIEGDGASSTVLLPPATHTSPCEATFGDVAICVANPPNPDGSVSKVVKGFELEGISVRGVQGIGIFLFGTYRADVDHVSASGNRDYGIFSNTSAGSVIEHNQTDGNGEAGIYIGDSPNAGAKVEHNVSKDNSGAGLLVRDASHGVVRDNDFSGNCFGAFFVNTGTGTSNWTASDNTSRDNTRACPAGQDAPKPWSGAGFILRGADHITLRDNSASGNFATGPTLGQGGVVVITSTNVRVVDNEVEHNAPAMDVFWDGNGTGNVFDDNDCATSIPAGLC